MSRQKIAIIDYGMGNLHSVASALEHVSPDSEIVVTDKHDEIVNADRVVFPGVGAMRDCMAEIKRLKLDHTVREVIESKRPMLAICVGMQALLESSDENDGVECLGYFAGRVKFFGQDSEFQSNNTDHSLKVPHMGWNQVIHGNSHPLWEGADDAARFYFVHSYFVDNNSAQQQSAETHYGRSFTSVLAKENVFAVQFHPEKSHTNGLRLLSNFCEWNGTV